MAPVHDAEVLRTLLRDRGWRSGLDSGHFTSASCSHDHGDIGHWTVETHILIDLLLPVSRILHHIHLCLIYDVIMRHIRDKYEAIMKQITLILGVRSGIFVYCQTTIKL